MLSQERKRKEMFSVECPEFDALDPELRAALRKMESACREALREELANWPNDVSPAAAAGLSALPARFLATLMPLMKVVDVLYKVGRANSN